MPDEAVEDYDAHPAGNIDPDSLVDITRLVSPGVYVSNKAPYSQVVGTTSISTDVVAVGTGTGIKDSLLKFSDFGDSNDHWETATNYDNTTDYVRYVNNTPVTGGDVWHNAKGDMNFTVDDGHRLVVLNEFIVKLALGNGQQTVEIGNSITPTGAKVLIVGETNDNTKATIQIQNASQSDLMTILNDGAFSLKTGTGVNEISTDSDWSGATDDQLVPKLTVKNYIATLVTPQIIGGVTLSSSSNTNILNGTYVILADTTTVTSVTSGIGQDSNWTLEVTQAGITNQKGVVTFTGNLQKDGGAGNKLYDIALFKNGSIISESEQEGQKLENGTKGQSVTVMAITEFSTNDTFDIRVSGNGTAEDIFCAGGSLYIQ